MQKKFVSSLLLLLFLNLLVKPLWIFGIDLTVQNRVGAEQYGLYAAIFSFTFVFNILLDLGLTHYNNRAIAQNPKEVARNFSKLTSLKFFLGIVYLLVSIALGYFLGYTSSSFYLLFILSVNQFLASFILFLRSHLSGLHLFKTDSLMSILDKILMISVCGVLLYGNVLNEDFTIRHFALAQMWSYLAAAFIGFVVVMKRAGSFSLGVSFSSYREDLKNSLPYALLILLMALYTRVDNIMIEQISGAFENGIYAQAFRLLDVVNQVSYLVGVLLLSIYARMFSNKEDVTNLSKLAFSLVIIATTAVVVSGISGAESIMSFLYVDHISRSALVFKILIVSSIAFGATYVFGTLLTARGDIHFLNRVALSGFILNIILNFIFIPYYGAVGAAWATVATQFATAIIQLWLSFRLAKIRFTKAYWGRLLLFGLLAVFTPFLLGLLEVQWWLAFVLNLVVICLLALPLGLLNVKAAIDLVRSRFTASS